MGDEEKFEYTGLEVVARRVGAGLTDAEQQSRTPVESSPGYLEFGVEIEGVFVPLAARKAGDIDQAIREAREQHVREAGKSSSSSSSRRKSTSSSSSSSGGSSGDAADEK